MPFIHLPDDQLHVFYVVNPRSAIPYPSSHHTVDFDDCGPIDPSKSNLLLLHAGCRSVSSFTAQFNDPRLKAQYNLICIAPKYHDRTEYYGNSTDEYTLPYAADIVISTMDAIAAELHLESYNVFGEGIAGAYIATLLAARRPTFVERLLLSSPGRLIETEEVSRALEDLLPFICSNKEGKGDATGSITADVLKENQNYAFGDLDRQIDRQNEHNSAFQMRYGTNHSSVDITQCFLSEAHRPSLPPDLLESIEVPILILHGERDISVSPTWAAEQWRKSFTKATGGAEVRQIVGGPHLLSFVEVNIINRIMTSFFSKPIETQLKFRVPPTPSPTAAEKEFSWVSSSAHLMAPPSKGLAELSI